MKGKKLLEEEKFELMLSKFWKKQVFNYQLTYLVISSKRETKKEKKCIDCLLYTSDAVDE